MLEKFESFAKTLLIEFIQKFIVSDENLDKDFANSKYILLLPLKVSSNFIIAFFIKSALILDKSIDFNQLQ